MIIIKVEVPIMGQEYNFQIDETVPIYEVQEEITEMICRRQQCRLDGMEHRLILWDRKRNLMLRREGSARDNGLETGSELLLA
jgi:hypothetical protein